MKTVSYIRQLYDKRALTKDAKRISTPPDKN